MNEETSLIGFKAICNFVNELETEYGKRHKPLRFYKRLVNHTQIAHDNAIKRHLSIFQTFCSVNRDAFSERDFKKFIEPTIKYSDRIFIDMNTIFTMADKETSDIIWKHLLIISAIVDPAGKAKELLRKAATEDKNVVAETDFLQNIISKVEQSVKPDSNPMEAISSIMQSGMLNDMMSDIGSKKLDMGKLLGVVQGMVTSFSNQATDNESKQALGMISNMMGNMNNPNGGAPDLSGMLSTMMSSLAGSGLTNGSNENGPDLSGMMQMMLNNMPKPENK
jgi:hypothetical protein